MRREQGVPSICVVAIDRCYNLNSPLKHLSASAVFCAPPSLTCPSIRTQGFAFAKEWCSKGNGPIYIEVDTYRCASSVVVCEALSPVSKSAPNRSQRKLEEVYRT